jgi:chemotaxis protein MotB
MRSKSLFSIALVCLAATSCVSQAKYDEDLKNASIYQRDAHDKAEYIAQLQAENTSLKNAMESMGDMEEGIMDAAFTEDIDARLASLQHLLAGAGHASDDVTLLKVEGGYGYSMSDAVLFGSGSDVISEDGKTLLVQMAKSIAMGEYERLWIRGHSDSDKVTKATTLKRFPNGNLQLSADRALGVAVVLSGNGGLPMAKMAIAGLGSSLPVASNETNEGKGQNRRVEIFVIEDPASDK